MTVCVFFFIYDVRIQNTFIKNQHSLLYCCALVFFSHVRVLTPETNVSLSVQAVKDYLVVVGK